MGQASDPGGGIGDFAGSLFGARDQLLQGRDAERWSDCNKHRVLRYEPDRQKILRHVDGNIWRGRAQRHEGRQHRLVERVSVRGGCRCQADREAAAGTRMVIHQDLLLPALGQPIGDNPLGHVRGAASGRIGNDLYRLVRVRPSLCISLGNGRYRQQPRQHKGPTRFHLTLHRPVRVWFGLGAPKKTPDEIIDKLNKEINAGLADSKLKARLADLGGTVLVGLPADFGKLITDDTEKWGKVIKFADIKPE